MACACLFWPCCTTQTGIHSCLNTCQPVHFHLGRANSESAYIRLLIFFTFFLFRANISMRSESHRSRCPIVLPLCMHTQMLYSLGNIDKKSDAIKYKMKTFYICKFQNKIMQVHWMQIVFIRSWNDQIARKFNKFKKSEYWMLISILRVFCQRKDKIVKMHFQPCTPATAVVIFTIIASHWLFIQGCRIFYNKGSVFLVSFIDTNIYQYSHFDENFFPDRE